MAVRPRNREKKRQKEKKGLNFFFDDANAKMAHLIFVSTFFVSS